jgi:hypothetical protein
MTSQLCHLPNGRQQFIDANGDPLVNGTVTMYQVGTEIYQNTWQDPNGTTLNTNPIVLDDLGSAAIYGSGSYRQILMDASGNTLWDEVVDSGLNSDFSDEAGGGLGGNGSVSTGVYITGLTATEAIAAQAPINIYYSGGQACMRNANAAAASQFPCHGFANAAVATGSSVPVYTDGYVAGLSGLTPGQDYYLGTGAGEISTVGATAAGCLYQRLGVALTTTTLEIDLMPAVLIG